MLNLSAKQEQLFQQSLKNIEGTEVIFVDAEKLLTVSSPNLEILKQQLENPFSVFICGEFNAGKSSLLNELGEQKLANVGILPTTKAIEAYYPQGFDGLAFIDSPGTNSIIDLHQELTENYLQRADIILFVTSVERPITKSEQNFLELVNNVWTRKVIVVVNKIDLVQAEELALVIDYVKQGLLEVFSQSPPIFTVSTKAKTGINELRKFLLEILVANEKLKLKLQGPQRSLLVYLEQLQKNNSDLQEKLLTEKKVFDKIVRRVDERIKEYDLLFGIYQQKINDVFIELRDRLNKLVDDNFVFLKLLKKRLIKEEDLLEERVAKEIKEAKVNEKTKDIVEDAVATLLNYRSRIFLEAQEDIETAATLLDNGYQSPNLDLNRLNVNDFSTQLKLASEQGLNNFLTLGTAAAATGIGAHIISTAAFFDFSAFVVALLLALRSFNAVPKQSEKVKEQVETSLLEINNNYLTALKQSLDEELKECRQQLMSTIQPKLSELENQINLSKTIQEKIQSSQQEINSLLEEIDKL